ncbi:MAG: hypothetical protein HC768_08350 [Acaryochloris sp. CRU_2_0]|nr:hypothetical protein [Acaryochloris sp. CRU_2_0]
MSEPEEPLFSSDSEIEEEPLGLKEPLGIIQRFIVPLGVNSLGILDSSIFLRDGILDSSSKLPVLEDFEQLTAPTEEGLKTSQEISNVAQSAPDLLQLSDEVLPPSTEDQSIERSLKNLNLYRLLQKKVGIDR